MTDAIAMRCNVCGGREFIDMRRRPKVRCANCNSLERTRAMIMLLEKQGVPRRGDRILHLAPEPGVTRWLVERSGEDGYDARDLEPERFEHCRVERLDLCAEAAELPSDHYHLILHSHVMEHVPCNWTAVLFHLHRALHPDGVHAFCIPFLPGAYDERWGGVSGRERVARFGQNDHVRRFGADDVQVTLGMVYPIQQEYDLEAVFEPEELERNNVPSYSRKGFTPDTVLTMRKSDLKLR